VGFPNGSPYQSALSATVSRWNGAPSMMFYGLVFGDTSVGLNNGQSEVWWQANPGAPAYTYWWWNASCYIVETDTLFDNTVAYTAYTTKSNINSYGGAYRPFRTTATHELGHVQGLGHTTNTYSVMGDDWTHIFANGGTALQYPGEDAVTGSVNN